MQWLKAAANPNRKKLTGKSIEQTVLYFETHNKVELHAENIADIQMASRQYICEREVHGDHPKTQRSGTNKRKANPGSNWRG